MRRMAREEKVGSKTIEEIEQGWARLQKMREWSHPSAICKVPYPEPTRGRSIKVIRHGMQSHHRSMTQTLDIVVTVKVSD